MKTLCALAALLAVSCSKPSQSPPPEPTPGTDQATPVTPEPAAAADAAAKTAPPASSPDAAAAKPAPAEPAAGDPSDRIGPEKCTADDDCVMTYFAGCCDCCGCTKKPYAIHAKELAAKKALCSRVRCNMSKCRGVECGKCPEEPAASQGVCNAGRCVAK